MNAFEFALARAAYRHQCPASGTAPAIRRGYHDCAGHLFRGPEKPSGLRGFDLAPNTFVVAGKNIFKKSPAFIVILRRMRFMRQCMKANPLGNRTMQVMLINYALLRETT